MTEDQFQLNLLDEPKTYIIFHHYEHDGVALYIKSRFNSSKRNAMKSF